MAFNPNLSTENNNGRALVNAIGQLYDLIDGGGGTGLLATAANQLTEIGLLGVNADGLKISEALQETYERLEAEGFSNAVWIRSTRLLIAALNDGNRVKEFITGEGVTFEAAIADLNTNVNTYVAGANYYGVYPGGVTVNDATFTSFRACAWCWKV